MTIASKPDLKIIPNISFEGVSFNQGINKVLFKDINLNFLPGDCCFITGETGSGKSTLLKLISGELLPHQGLIKVFNTPVNSHNVECLSIMRQKIGLVLQTANMFSGLTLFENVLLPLTFNSTFGHRAFEFCEELMVWVGLKDYLHKYPHQVSRGEQQLAAIARAVIRKPKIILADEPTIGIEDNRARRVLHLFSELARFGACVIIATHNKNLVMAKGFPEYRIKKGELIYQDRLKGSSTITAAYMRRAYVY